MANQKKNLLSVQNVTKKSGAASDSDAVKRSANRDLSAARSGTRKAPRLAANHSLTVR
jgi:hypothetical protein